MALKLAKKKTSIQKINKKPTATHKTSVSQREDKHDLPELTGTFIEAVGRRKTATARVRIYPATKGEFRVNSQIVGKYFSGIRNAQFIYQKPLEATGTTGKFAVSVVVNGSGIASQLAAVVHGLSRCLVELNAEYRPLLKKIGLLTRDDRMKETRKIGTGGKARRKRQSPKR